MATGLIELVKRASLEAMENEKICDLRYGTVSSTDPLRVQITNQLTIPSSLLVVPQHLTDYAVRAVLVFEDGDMSKHNTQMIVRNALQVGDKVALLRKQGGQSYFILDRI